MRRSAFSRAALPTRPEEDPGIQFFEQIFEVEARLETNMTALQGTLIADLDRHSVQRDQRCCDAP
jgi:hypothetical protein